MLGRGTAVINTGGEKVWPEEVEAALRNNPDVLDVAVVGQEDARWGQRVTAVLQMSATTQVSDARLASDCRENLAPTSAPRTGCGLIRTRGRRRQARLSGHPGDAEEA